MTTQTRNDTIEHRIGREGLLVLRLQDGDVRIRGVAGDTARVRTTDGESIDGFAIERGETSLSISASEGGDGHRRRGSSEGIDLDVEVPEAATVMLEAASADIDAARLSGEQRLRTASGDLRVRDVQGTLNVDAVSGDVQIRANGPLAATARTVSGDLELEALLLRSLLVTTTSGDISIEGRFEGDGPFRIETVSGDTSLELSGPFRVEATSLTGDIQGDHRGPGRDRGPVVLGSDSGPTIVFRSTSGDLSVGPGRVAIAPSTEAAPAQTTDSFDPDEPDAPDDPATLETLRALERGDIDLDEARRRLSAGATDTDA